MKNIWKRTVAFILTVCMLLSVLPPLVFATTESLQPNTPMDQITYDFRLDTLGLKFTNTANVETGYANQNIVERNAAGTALNATSVLRQEAIANYYADGTLNWKMHSATGSHFSIGANGKNDQDQWIVNWRSDSAYAYNKKVGDAYTAGHYFAMTVRSPGTGDYDVTLNYGTSANGAAQGSVYLLAADADLTTALTSENALGTVDFEEGTNAIATAATKTFGKSVTMEADKEYLLVFKCDQVGAKVNAMYLNSVVLNRNIPVSAITYDFRLDAQDLKFTNTANIETGYANQNIVELNDAGTSLNATSVLRQEAIANHYENNTLNWKCLNADFTHAVVSTIHNSLYIYHKTFTTGNYFAVTVRSPGTGNYRMTVNHGQNKQGSTQGGIYLFDASVNPADWATTTPLFRDYVDYSRNANTTAVTSTAFDNTIPMEADKTYTLVFTNEGAANADIGGSFNAMYLSSVVLEAYDPTQETTAPTETTESTESTETTESTEVTEATEAAEPEELPPLQVDEILYDFGLEDAGLTYTHNGSTKSFYNINFLENSIEGRTMRATVDDYYAAGTLHWKYNTNTGSHFITGKTEGGNWGAPTYMYYKNSDGAYTDGYYFAATVRSPGTGDYKLTLNYGTATNGAAKGSIYLLPGDTADIAAAIASGTAIGSVCYEGTSARATPAAETFDAVLNLETGKEYIVVFVCDQAGAKLNAQYVQSVVLKKYVPGAVEPETPALQVDELIYDLGLADAGLTPTGNESFYNVNVTESSNTGKRLRADIEDYYNAGKIHWKIHSYTGSHFITGKTEGGNWGAPTYMYYKNSDGAYTDGYYFALTIRSPGTGDYQLTLNYGTTVRGAAKSSIYLLPGDTQDIAAAIAATKPVGKISYEGKSAMATLVSEVFNNRIPMVAGQEYIVVFVCDQAGEKLNGQYVQSVKLTKAKPPMQADKIVYDFDLGGNGYTYNTTTAANKSFVTANLASAYSAAVKAAVAEYYNAESIHWKYHSGTEMTNPYIMFGGDAKYDFDGISLSGKNDGVMVTDFYYAMTIRSPGTGNYKLTLDYGAHINGAKQGSIYILPSDTEDIPAAIAANKAIGTVNCDNGKTGIATADPGRNTYQNAVSMKAGEEYLLVFTCDKVGRSNAFLYIDTVTLTREDLATPADIIPERKPEPKPIPAGSTVYDLDLVDSLTGIYRTKTFIKDAVDDINGKYEKGLTNWGWYGDDMLNIDGSAFVAYGMATYGKEMEWIALKIKSPGKGLYTLGMNHAISTDGAIGAVYILPADTQDVGSARNLDNRVGKVSFTDMSGVSGVTDHSQTLAGTWEFGEDEEYILVIEAYEKSYFHESRAYMWISQIFMTPGDIMPEETTQKVVSPIVVDPGPIKILEGTYYGATSQVNGNDYMFMPVEGNKMLVFDLDNDLMVDQVEIPCTRTYAVELDADGNVWLGGEGKSIFRYDPYTQTGKTVYQVSNLNSDAKAIFYMKYVDGYLYFGMSGSCTIGRYNIATGEATEFGPFHDDTVYLNAIEYKDGYLYAALAGDKNNDGVMLNRIIKVDAATGEQVDYLDVNELVSEDHKIFTGIGFAGDLLLVGSSVAYQNMLAIDPETMEYVDLGIRANIMWEITEEVDGKVYFLLNGMGLHSMDVETHEVKLVPGFNNANRPVRCCKHSIVEIDDPVYPGISIATYSASTGDPWVYNLQSGKTKSYYELIDNDLGLGVTMRSLISGESGSNMLYMGAYNTPTCVAYNTLTGEFTEFEAISAQTDSMVLYDGVLYSGNYTTGCITRINLEDKSKNQVLLTLNDEIYDQARIHTLAAGDDKIFAGSTPDIAKYGGCLAWVDLKTLERHVVQNVVQDQTVNCVIYHDGLVYGTTSIHGGTGSKLREDLSAKLFIYDVDNKTKLGEFDLRNYISGMEGNIDYIGGIAADPKVDENGRFWGIVSETLFSFTYDRETNELSVKEELSFRKNYYPTGGSRNWFPKPFRFDDQGNLYLSFEDAGGLRRINTNDVSDNERVVPASALHYTLGEDNNFYYLIGSALYMYPLNVTEDDWAKADAVDQIFLALPAGKDITVADEEQIVAARIAYDALELRYKALIQNLEVLEEAEVRLLEQQINALPAEVTLEHQDMIQGLVAKYTDMTKRQQLYVKNYDMLEMAMNALQVLLDKQAAAAVQEMIDSIKDLGEITLDHKTRIDEIRAAYDALSSSQKAYVDKTLLEEAEAKLAVLWEQEIQRLRDLIASIGEVTLEDEPIIMEADRIFNLLTLQERQTVDGATLSSAKIQLTKLQKAAAGEVDALIGKIGKVGIFSGMAISKARKAYDALTEGSKAYVTLADALIAAEKAFKPIEIALWCIGGVVVAGGGAATVVLVRKKRKIAAPTQKTPPTE